LVLQCILQIRILQITVRMKTAKILKHWKVKKTTKMAKQNGKIPKMQTSWYLEIATPNTEPTGKNTDKNTENRHQLQKPTPTHYYRSYSSVMSPCIINIKLSSEVCPAYWLNGETFWQFFVANLIVSVLMPALAKKLFSVTRLYWLVTNINISQLRSCLFIAVTTVAKRIWSWTSRRILTNRSSL